MPTYEYACKSCGEHLEVVQSFSDDSLTVCPNCGGPLRKVFGSIGISFKGSGFYRTDSRPAATKKEKDQEKAKEKSASGKDGSPGGDGGAKKEPVSTGSSSESSSSSGSTASDSSSSSKPDSSSSKSGGSDKAKATAAPA